MQDLANFVLILRIEIRKELHADSKESIDFLIDAVIGIRE